MKSSFAFRKQQGFSPLSVLVVIVLTTIVIFQFVSILRQKNLLPTQSQNLTQETTGNKALNQVAQVVQPKVTPVQNIEKYLVAEAALLGVTDNISLYYQDLQASAPVSLEPTKSWIPASTIKAYVLLEAFRQNRLGLINFNDTVTVKAQNVVPTELETNDYPRLREGTQATIRQLAEAMIVQSDNTAYNSLLDVLDRRNINASLRNIGITETVVGEKLNLDGDQYARDLQVPGREPNTTTVKDLATYFDLLYTHQIPDADAILDIFKRQKINNMIPALLPNSTTVAHKTGDWAPIYHDGGIVYKPDDPFVFVAFTNSGDPAIVAKLAEVAYYGDPKYIGKSTAFVPNRQNLIKNLTAIANRPIYYDNNSQVLGEATPTKFPEITAEDLGITSKDLMPDSRQINDIAPALVTPSSIWYGLKTAIENAEINLTTGNSQKSLQYLKLANSRLSEIKTELTNGNVGSTDQLLTQAYQNLKKATDLASNDPNKDKLYIEIKKTNDLYYGVMADRASNLSDDKKAEFVDSVYNFYQQEKTDIAPKINSSVIVTPTQQKPTVGVVQNVSSSEMTLKFDDGSTKQVNLSTGTNVRAVDQETTQDLEAVKVGNKVAVLGPSGSDNSINAQFILNDVPKGLTDQHQGTVTEVNPNSGVIKVVDSRGQVSLVKVDDNTAVKSRDTDVSIEGIKAGSQVVVFGIPEPESSSSAQPGQNNSNQATSSGQTNNPLSSGQPSPSTSSGNKSNASTSPSSSNKPGSSQTSTSTPAPTTAPTTQIKATTVTIVGNSSGKNEQTSAPAKSTPSTKTPSSSGSSKPAPAAPAPAKPEPAKPEPPKPEPTKAGGK